MRAPLVIVNDSRDSSRSKDSWGINCFQEQVEEEGRTYMVKRPGMVLSDVGRVTGQGVFNWNNLAFAVDGDYLRELGMVRGPTNANVPFVSYSGAVWSSGNSTSISYSTDGFTFLTDPGFPLGIAAYTQTYGPDVLGSPYSSAVYGVYWNSTVYVLYNQPANFAAGYTDLDSTYVPSGAIPLSNGVTIITDQLQSYWLFAGTTGTELIRYTANLSVLLYWIDKTVVNIPGYSGQPFQATWFPATSKFYATMYPYSKDYVETSDVFVTSTVRSPFPYGSVVQNFEVIGSTLYAGVIFNNQVRVYSSGDGVVWTPASVAYRVLPPATAITSAVIRRIGTRLAVYTTTDAGVTVSRIDFFTGILMAVTTPGLPFDFVQAPIAAGLNGFFFKSTADAFYYDGTTLAKVTDADYPASTVRGVAYLDGTFYVMNKDGVIFGSEINSPLSWDALNFITAQMEPDGGIYLARLLNFIIAFGEYTTEFFYDAGNPTGSPLASYSSSMINVGCAVAGSVAQANNQIFFMGVTKQKGRGIYNLTGTSPTAMSTPSIERILNADDLANVRSFCVRISGHNFYVLTLGTTDITLACDISTGDWKEWTSLKAAGTAAVTSIVFAIPMTAVVTLPSHGVLDGGYVQIFGATESEYNGYFTVHVIDANTFSYVLATDPGGNATGAPFMTPFVSGAFKGIYYTGFGTQDLIQDSGGNIYTMDTTIYMDDAIPVAVHIRTDLFDGQENDKKFFSRLQVIGDMADTSMFVRYTGNDYQDWSSYRQVNMSKKRAVLNRLGQDRRRAFELLHQDNTPLRLEGLELTVEKGSN